MKSLQNTKVIIICAGEGTRWGNYQNTPKHLVDIEGEPNLHRTVRLLRHLDCDTYIVARGNDERYKIDDSTYYEADLNENNFDADKFLSSKKLWNKEGRTVVLYGDCFFSEYAIRKIMMFNDRRWTLFARFGGSMYTNCEWGECFAQSFYPESIPLHEENLQKLVALQREGKLNRCGGWEHYRLMSGQENPNIHVHAGHLVEIDDYTEDFDFPEDYEKWKHALLENISR